MVIRCEYSVSWKNVTRSSYIDIDPNNLLIIDQNEISSCKKLNLKETPHSDREFNWIERHGVEP